MTPQNANNAWIITDVLGDGKFKAVPKSAVDFGEETIEKNLKRFEWDGDANLEESFDISGKVDTNNPIYKFYEKDMQKYLTKFGGKRVKDAQGVEWIEVPVNKEWAKLPVEAFAALPFVMDKDQ